MFGLKWFKGRDVRPAVTEALAPSGGFATIFGAPAGQAPADTRSPARPVVPIIGNCLAETLAQGLSAQPVLASAFAFVAVPVHLRSLDDAAVQEMLAGARHIVVQSNLAEQLDAVRAIARPGAAIIVYPNVVLRSLWPFDAQAGYRDEAIVDTPSAVIRHHDGVLARLRTAEPDPQRRYERYRALDFDEAGTIDRIAAAQARFHAIMDEETQAELGAFMTAQFQTVPLFYNSTHPSGALFQALAAFIWTRLDMAGRPPVFTDMDHWKTWSVPVHPAIARRLGVGWATERTRYNYATLGQITWEEWVRAYIARLG